MSTAVHTPGPWEIKVANDGCGDIGIVGDGGVVAECFHEIRARDERAYKEMTANARLIGAAPEMLAALYSAQIAMSNIGMQDHLIDYQGCRAAGEQVTTAIAKATGAAA